MVRFTVVVSVTSDGKEVNTCGSGFTLYFFDTLSWKIKCDSSRWSRCIARVDVENFVSDCNVLNPLELDFKMSYNILHVESSSIMNCV